MIKNKKKLIALFLFAFFFIATANFVFALEINYPTVPGTMAPQEFLRKIEAGEILEEQALSLFIVYFFNLFLIITALVAFGVIVYAGIRYLVSAGNPAILSDAKNQIFSAFLGLVIVLSSYLILYTIDPGLVILKPPGIESAPIVEPLAPVPVEERIHTYQEIPVGILIGRVLDKEKLNELQDISLKVKSSSEELKKLTQELKILTDRCDCERLSPNAASCSYWQPCPATECPGDPCPNRGAINAKIEEINSKIKELEGYIDEENNYQPGLLAEAETAHNDLKERFNNLQTGENYLSGFEWEKGCAKMEIIEHDMVVWLEKGGRKIEIVNLFPEFIPGTEERTLINRGILNFYCRI